MTTNNKNDHKEEPQTNPTDDAREAKSASAESAAQEQDETKQEQEDEILKEDIMKSSMWDLQEGDIVPGTVIGITKNHVLVDVGYKSEGQVSIEEFIDAEGKVNVKPGDKVDVYIVDAEDESGAIILSKDKAEKQKVWEDISKAHEEGAVVEGVIVQRIKGGLVVDIGVKAFLPGSQIDLRPVRDMDGMIGKRYKFKVIQYNRKRGNIVLSRRQLLEKEREEKRQDTLGKLAEGAVVTGIVKNITDYGVFIDLGGIDGLLHITDISWGKVNHPSDHFHVGDQVKVKVLSFDQERMRVSLGYKQISEDPWKTATQKYQVGVRVKGKVVNITDYGVFVELEPGIEGLIHITEMSWTKKVRHPSRVVSVGDLVEVEVLDLDSENRRISLSMKKVEPNPWDVLQERHPVNSVVEGKIKNVTDFGIFVDIGEGIDGLVHISDLTRRKRVKHPSELFKKGQRVKAIVLRVDKEAERFSLGIKQLEPDPWEELPALYPPGSVVKGRVTKILDFGAFVEILDGVEGLVHISELSGKEKVGHPKDVLQVNQELDFKVINIDVREKKIGLSLRALEEDKEAREVKDYFRRQDTGTVFLGDILEAKLNEKKEEAKAAENKDNGEPGSGDKTEN